MADSKKLSFSASSKAEQIPPKFHGFVLGLVGLNDAKGIDLAQPVWPWAYVGQPHCHIGWVLSMPFASINPTNPWTDQWNFWEKILRIGELKNSGSFESIIIIFWLHTLISSKKLVGYKIMSYTLSTWLMHVVVVANIVISNQAPHGTFCFQNCF